MFFAFAEVSAANQSGLTGIPTVDLDPIVNKYLSGIFNKYLQRSDFRVTELSFVDDREKSTDELVYVNVIGRFRNFSIINRILYGRLETTIAVRRQRTTTGIIRRTEGTENVILDSDNTDIVITLLVDDNLSDELRDAMVRNYVMRNYDNPLALNIQNEKLEVYSDKIFSYVTSVVDNDKIVYLRAIFENWPPLQQRVDIFFIKETPWQLNRAEVLYSVKIPDNNFIKDIQKEVFEHISKHYRDNNPRGQSVRERLSRVSQISNWELKEANNKGEIKVGMDIEYTLDLQGFIGSYKKYNIKLNAFYKFNFDTGKWEYRGIEPIRPENIIITR